MGVTVEEVRSTDGSKAGMAQAQLLDAISSGKLETVVSPLSVCFHMNKLRLSTQSGGHSPLLKQLHGSIAFAQRNMVEAAA